MMPNRRQMLSLALAGAAPLGLLDRAWAAGTSTLGGRAFGSYWRLSLVGDGEGLLESIDAVIRSVDRAMSPYRADSETSRFSASRSTDWVAVSPHTHSVVAAALAMARHCNGFFDPTVGPLVGRFGFGPMRGERSGDHRQLALGAGAIRKHDPGLSLDLCGIAKGHALDRIVAALDAQGLQQLSARSRRRGLRARPPSCRPRLAGGDRRPAC